MTSAKELAIAKAAEEHTAAIKQLVEQRKFKQDLLRREATESFQKLFGFPPDQVLTMPSDDPIADHRIASGELMLVWHKQRWFVVGTCPNCKTEVLSSACYSLGDIGRELSKPFTPGWHACRYVPLDEDKAAPIANRRTWTLAEAGLIGSLTEMIHEVSSDRRH